MPKLKIADLRKYLAKLSRKELEDEIVQLAKNYEHVSEYFCVKVHPDCEDVLLEECESFIRNEFVSDAGFGEIDYGGIIDTIENFVKISKKPANVVKLLFCYLESCVEYVQIYPDIGIIVSKDVEKAYERALDIAFKNDMSKDFYQEAINIFLGAQNSILRFSANIYKIFASYYDNHPNNLEKK